MRRGRDFAHDVGLEGFEWVDANDDDNSVFAFMRKGRKPEEVVLALFDCRRGTATRLPGGGSFLPGVWRELLNTDAEAFGGSGLGNLGKVTAEQHRRSTAARSRCD